MTGGHCLSAMPNQPELRALIRIDSRFIAVTISRRLGRSRLGFDRRRDERLEPVVRVERCAGRRRRCSPPQAAIGLPVVLQERHDARGRSRVALGVRRLGSCDVALVDGAPERGAAQPPHRGRPTARRTTHHDAARCRPRIQDRVVGWLAASRSASRFDVLRWLLDTTKRATKEGSQFCWKPFFKRIGCRGSQPPLLATVERGGGVDRHGAAAHCRMALRTRPDSQRQLRTDQWNARRVSGFDRPSRLARLTRGESRNRCRCPRNPLDERPSRRSH